MSVAWPRTTVEAKVVVRSILRETTRHQRVR